MANYKMDDELLRRIDHLERKVCDLQIRNQKLESMLRDTFISFKFRKETENIPTESEEMSRIRMITQILNRR